MFFLGQVFYNLIAAEQGGHLADDAEDGFAVLLFADGEGPDDILRDRPGGFADRPVRGQVVQGVAQSADNGNLKPDRRTVPASSLFDLYLFPDFHQSKAKQIFSAPFADIPAFGVIQMPTACAGDL